MPLDPNTSYNYRFINGTDGLRDTMGNPLGFFTQAGFGTADTADTSGPVLQLASPFDGAETAPANSQLRMQFDEPINSLTVADNLASATCCPAPFRLPRTTAS